MLTWQRTKSNRKNKERNASYLDSQMELKRLPNCSFQMRQ